VSPERWGGAGGVGGVGCGEVRRVSWGVVGWRARGRARCDGVAWVALSGAGGVGWRGWHEWGAVWLGGARGVG